MAAKHGAKYGGEEKTNPGVGALVNKRTEPGLAGRSLTNPVTAKKSELGGERGGVDFADLALEVVERRRALHDTLDERTGRTVELRP